MWAAQALSGADRTYREKEGRIENMKKRNKKNKDREDGQGKRDDGGKIERELRSQDEECGNLKYSKSIQMLPREKVNPSYSLYETHKNAEKTSSSTD